MKIEDTLTHSITEYDRKQEARHIKNPRFYHNPYALAQYLVALERVHEEQTLGRTMRQALVNNFTGRLLDVCLKSVGESPSTEVEQRMNGRYGL